MAAATTNALFVTANVGSIFEDPTSMLKIWCDEFLNTISRLTPKVIALHCQEVGGKNYERSMQHVSEFVKLLMSSEELQPFNKVRIYLDEDYSSAEHFTALGNFYFIHESIPDEHVEIFNFQEKKFECVVGKEVFSENIEDVPTKEKSKFPQEIFPECKWSRKGFMRTRWNLNGTVFDLVNIHLFHDASNFVAMESFPSVYCKNRQRALDHTLKRFHNDQYGNVPFFVFGDFNFRTDTQGVVKKLSEGLNAVKVQGSKSTDHSKLQYRDESSQQVVLTLGKKEFSHQDHQKLFLGGDSEWLREFDRESESFDDQLFEFNIDFPPSYPYVEDSEKGELYMQTRCPSWCDRVFLSSSARMLVDSTAKDSPLEYGLIGLNACMGDHKPVFLRATLIGGLGTVSCCALPAAPCTSCLSAATPLEHICRLCAEQSVEPSSFPMFAEPEQDHTGLVVPKFHRHTSPYTPDSTDTEPDLGEETCREEPFIIKNRNERRLSRFDISRKRLHITDEQYEDTEEDENLKPSAPKCFSKIPVRITDHKETNSVTRVHISKLPVPKVTSAKSDKDFSLKCKTVKQASSPASKHNLDSRLNSKKDIACSSNQGAIVTQDISFVSEPKSVDGRKLCRQMNVDENSSDSDSTSLEMEDQCPILEQRAEEPKVEIQFSLVETSPNLSPIDCESDGLLTTNEQRLGGSTTDSGVSVSPDFSVTTSPSTDGQDKIVHETISNVESNFEVGLRGEINPSSLERFSFVRRIQSASAMERKSSFPFPSSTFVETESTLSGFGGSGSDLWGMRTCRCMSDGSWRQRSSTISHSMLSSRADSRIRLISTSSHLDRSLPRLQSHHSSSDEEWFEEITNDLKEDFKTELGQSLNNDSGKVKRKAELTKRLSTHQECEKTSDPNISVEKISTIISSEGIHQESTQPVFEGQDLKLGTLHCKSTMTPPSLEQLSTLKIDDESCSVKARNQPQETKSDELIESSASEFLLRNTKELLNHDESKTAAENAALQIRRSSINSNSSKNQNSKNCKACCIVL